MGRIRVIGTERKAKEVSLIYILYIISNIHAYLAGNWRR